MANTLAEQALLIERMARAIMGIQPDELGRMSGPVAKELHDVVHLAKPYMGRINHPRTTDKP